MNRSYFKIVARGEASHCRGIKMEKVARRVVRGPMRAVKFRVPRIAVRDADEDDSAGFEEPQNFGHAAVKVVGVFEHMPQRDDVVSVVGKQRLSREVGDGDLKIFDGGVFGRFVRFNALDGPAGLFHRGKELARATTDVEQGACGAVAEFADKAAFGAEHDAAGDVVTFVEEAAGGIADGRVVGAFVKDVDVVGGGIGIGEAKATIGAGGNGELAAMRKGVAAGEEGCDFCGAAKGAMCGG